MSDRRVLATSAAIIVVAIMAFLALTFPRWRAAIGSDEPSVPFGLAAKPPSTEVATGTGTPDAPQAGGAPTRAAAVDASARSATEAPKAADASNPTALAAIPPASTAVKAAGARPAVTDAAAVDADAKPSFDVVRVEPSGDSVVAARAAPGADIVLLDQGQPIAHAKADASGQVAFVPPTLAPGDHSLMLSVGDPKSPSAISAQSVAVTVPSGGKGAPLVALIAPDQPTRILAGGGGPAAGGPGAAGPAPGVAVSSIDVEEFGSVFATGKAAPDSHCRVYLNGSFIASVTAGKDGNWSLKIQRGMKPGRYSVRVDQVQPASGQVQARAEVPFDYPARLAGSASLFRPKPGGGAGVDRLADAGFSPTTAGSVPVGTGAAQGGTAGGSPPSAAGSASASASLAPAQPGDVSDAAGASDAVVSQLLTAKVVHGDSLWRISRKVLGKGFRYVQIYAANSTQIRDPKLIYPGQIFVLPQGQ